MTGRLGRLREGYARLGCDAFFSVSPPNNQYLTGFLSSFIEISSVLIVTDNEALFLTDSRYTEQAEAQVSGCEVIEIKGDQLLRCGERLSDLGVKKAAYDPATLTIDEMSRFQTACKAEVVADKTLVSTMRMIKSPEEITALRAASELAEGVLADLLPTLEEGLTERELAAQFEYEFKKRGASGASFDTIALFGPRSSLPHGEPGGTCVKAGDVILLDFGCRYAGYCSDLTRTYGFGTIPGAWFEEVYSLVLAAQMIALEAVRAGVTCREVDATARNLIAEGGYGAYFGHGLGHGVGIEIHEAPRLNPESEVVLEEGMVVTVEPGIYLPGQGGVRIEDLIVVTGDGCDILSSAPKELRVLAS